MSNGNSQKTKDATAPQADRKRSARYPRHGLKEAEKLAVVAFRLGPRHVAQGRLAKELGYSRIENGGYRAKRASAGYFGLVEAAGADYLSVSEEWIQALHSENENDRQVARQNAVQKPSLYKQLFEAYGNKMLPPKERLERELQIHEHYGIKKDAIQEAVDVFLRSVKYAGLVDDNNFLRLGDAVTAETLTEALDEVNKEADKDDVEAEIDEDGNSGASTHAQEQNQVDNQIIDEDLDRIEVRLPRGRKAYLLIPAPGILSKEDKERMKGYIDLILEEDEL